MKNLISKIFLVFLALAGGASLEAQESQALYPNEMISMEELKQLVEKKEPGVLLLDARGARSYEAAHILGAVRPFPPTFFDQEELFRTGKIQMAPDTQEGLKQFMASYTPAQSIVTYCGDHCQASTTLLFRLKQMGFENVRAMKNGFESWQAKGYPTVVSDLKNSKVISLPGASGPMSQEPCVDQPIKC